MPMPPSEVMKILPPRWDLIESMADHWADRPFPVYADDLNTMDAEYRCAVEGCPGFGEPLTECHNLEHDEAWAHKGKLVPIPYFHRQREGHGPKRRGHPAVYCDPVCQEWLDNHDLTGTTADGFRWTIPIVLASDEGALRKAAWLLADPFPYKTTRERMDEGTPPEVERLLGQGRQDEYIMSRLVQSGGDAAVDLIRHLYGSDRVGAALQERRMVALEERRIRAARVAAGLNARVDAMLVGTHDPEATSGPLPEE